MSSIIESVDDITRLSGFLYGAFIWSDLSRIDFEDEPLTSALKGCVYGCLGLFTAGLFSSIGPAPISDAIVIGAITVAAHKRINLQ
jgi:hypothetical protein